MNVRYRVTLSSEERAQLQGLVSGGKGRVRRIKRAQILLATESGASDEAIAANVAVGTSTIYRTKRRFVEEGLEQALSEDPRPGASTRTSRGDMPRSPTAARQPTSPSACGTSDDHYPKAELIRVVLDNLSTHTAAALYETFAPEEARRIL